MNTVTILMSTYNGEKYIDEQIKSIVTQKNVDVKILVRDDGSSDMTIEKLNFWKQKGILDWYTGENLKPARSFMNLVYNAPESEYYAFCDQDDFWLEDKLFAAIKMLKENKTDADIPILYSCPTTEVDADLNIINTTIDDKNYGKTFLQCLIASNASGCTMVFNRKLLEIMRIYDPKFIVMHDGWVHKVCLSVSGIALRDKKSYIYYRQHGDNVIGGKKGFFQTWKRRSKSVFKNPNSRSTQLKEIYYGYKNMINKDHIEKLYMAAFYKEKLSLWLKLLFDRSIKFDNKNINFYYKFAVLFRVF